MLTALQIMRVFSRILFGCDVESLSAARAADRMCPASFGKTDICVTKRTCLIYVCFAVTPFIFLKFAKDRYLFYKFPHG